MLHRNDPGTTAPAGAGRIGAILAIVAAAAAILAGALAPARAADAQTGDGAQRRAAPAQTSATATQTSSAAPQSSTAAARKARARLTGTWTRYPEIDEKPDPRYPPAPPIGPPPLKAQYKADWEARQKAVREADARGQPPYSNYTGCLPDGMPAMMMAMFPLEVLQTPGQITIIEEAYNQVRRIYLDEKQLPIADAEPGYWGHSVGHWDGDTLVVDTVGVKEAVRFRDTPHSDQMRIAERIRLITPELLRDDVTVEDPAYLEGAWKFTWIHKRLPGYKMAEYVCDANREYKDPETGATRLRIGDH